MIKKIVISSLIMLLLFSSTAQAQNVPTVSKFSYSDDLKAGDKFAWKVSSTYSIQDPLFKDGSVITLEILKDLAGKEFSGDLKSAELTDYFDLDFGDSAFVSDEDAISIVVFPNSVTFENGTTIDPLQGFWADVLINQVDVSNGAVESVSTSKSGEILTVEATIKYTVANQPLESQILAKINTQLGIMEEYNLDLKTAVGEQTLDVVKVDVTDVDKTSSSTPAKNTDDQSASDDASLPVNFGWIVGTIVMIPIIRKYR